MRNAWDNEAPSIHKFSIDRTDPVSVPTYYHNFHIFLYMEVTIIRKNQCFFDSLCSRLCVNVHDGTLGAIGLSEFQLQSLKQQLKVVLRGIDESQVPSQYSDKLLVYKVGIPNTRTNNPNVINFCDIM